MVTDPLAAALAYAARGWHVFPVWGASAPGVCQCGAGGCDRIGKHPVSAAAPHGKDDATTDPGRIAAWWARWPAASIGLAVEPSGLQVLDVDGAAGRDSLGQLGELPATLTARTGSGGLHLVYARGSAEPRQAIKIRPGLDLIGRGYIIVAPSVHASGAAYAWEHDVEPEPLPDVLRRLERLAPPPPVASPRDRARAYLATIPGAVSGQGGHTTTFLAASALVVGFALDADEALALLTTDYNPRCTPPWSEREIAHKIRSAAEQSRRPRGYLLDRPMTAATPSAPSSAPSAWPEGLLVGTNGQPRRGYHNTAYCLLAHPQFAGRWSLDEMAGTPCLDGAPLAATAVGELRDAIETHLGYSPPVSDVESAVLAAASKRPFHRIRDYLNSCQWDGTPRLSDLARDALGVDTEIAAVMVRKWAISAVARVMAPGCKVDTCLVLQGPQGYGKSTFFSALAGDWHVDTYVDMGNKDSLIQLASSWIYELGELDEVIKGRNEERAKSWITSTHDVYRAPYARVAERHARSCVLVGTVNPEEFLRDATGDRRYWIVSVARRIDLEDLRYARDQLWAEALCAYESGEQWWLTDEQEAWRAANNETYHERDSWETRITAFLGPRIQEITVSDALQEILSIEPARQDRAAQMRVARILRRLGWRRAHRRVAGHGRRWVYVAPEAARQPEMPS